eukprot:scaffold108064_cov15-Tisochrysis_lutea.AAC.1
MRHACGRRRRARARPREEVSRAEVRAAFVSSRNVMASDGKSLSGTCAGSSCTGGGGGEAGGRRDGCG